MAMNKPIDSTWTDEQWEAIVTRGNNTLVAAAAGSGKTAVLVERIIRMIIREEDLVDVDRLLVVTFTKAAAAEMRQRIGAAIEKELGKNPSSLHLRRQLTLLNKANIMTLHSFCMEILQRYSYLIDLDPAFRIADETEADLLRRDVLDVVMEEEYGLEGEEGPFTRLVDYYGGDRDDSALKELLLSVYDFSRSHPWPNHWLAEVLSNFQDVTMEKINSAFWFRSLMEDVDLDLKGVQTLLEDGEYLASSPGGPIPYLDNLQQEIPRVKEVREALAVSWEAAYRAIAHVEFGRLKACRGQEYDKALQDRVKGYRDTAKKRILKVRDELFSIPPQVYLDNLMEMSPLMEKMVNLVLKFTEGYQRAKGEKGLVDFSDLEHFALKILLDKDSTPDSLYPSSAAMDYRAQFKEVLVDEYQDTNMVQETILLSVSKSGEDGKGNLFMVGDVKQSIYRFRLAEPTLFMHKYRLYHLDGQGPGKRIDLAKNFRSRREVLDGVNFIFKQIMSESIAEMEYDEAAELIPGADYYPDPGEHDVSVEVFLIDRNENAGENGQGEDENGDTLPEKESSEDLLDPAELETVQLETRLIADKIIELIGRNSGKPYQIFDKKTGEMRPVSYRDIVVLLRATSAWAPAMIEEFKLRGIPAYAEFSSGYFEATEVEIMLSLLCVIDNPMQDIPLAAVLRSPFVGLHAEEMAQIRIGERSGSYFEALQAYIGDGEEGNVPLQEKLLSFLEKVENWRTEARQGALSSLIWQIYRETGYFDFVGGLPGGRQRQANLRALYDRACQYETTSFRGLFRFLRFIEKMRDQGGDMGTARSLGEQEDVVRVMTIHKSKGLEFPVVFAAGLGKKFNLQDLYGSFLLHKELGFGPKYVDGNLRVSYPTLFHIAMKRRLLREQLAEEMRVLYVALTRARDKLYLLGTASSLEKSLENWGKTAEVQGWHLPDFQLVKGRSFLDWIGPALLRHRDVETLADVKVDFSPLEGVRQHPSQWKLHLVHQNDLADATPSEKELDIVIEQALVAGEPVPLISSSQEEVNHRLSWKYAYSGATRSISKLSVSELKRRHQVAVALGQEEEGEGVPLLPQTIVKRPRFMREEKMAPNEKGTVMHAVMQYIPLTRSFSGNEVKEIVDRMVQEELLQPSEAEVVQTEAIASFLQSSLGQRFLSSPQVYRELAFTLALPAEEAFPEWERTQIDGEKVLVQGVIDCLFQEEGGWVLLDYKTDKTTPFSDGELAERYRVQLDYYALAIERILQQPIKETVLYFFDGGKIIGV